MTDHATHRATRHEDGTKGRVRKAVLPVGGLGTRFLPFSKACPKEMLPILDKPLVQYAVEEAAAAGITQIVFVTASAKRMIEDHFDAAGELERTLRRNGRHDLLASIALPEGLRFAAVRQPEPRGLGDAVLRAREIIGDEPFAVMLPDDLLAGDPPVLAQLIEAFDAGGHSVVAVEDVPRAETDRYGIVEPGAAAGRSAPVRSIVEKPRPEEAPSTLAVVGRYVFTPAIFDHLDGLEPRAKGEVQLTDAIAALLAHEPVCAYRFAGRRFDCGSKLGFLAATLHYGLAHPELAIPFRALIEQEAGRRERPARLLDRSVLNIAAAPAAAPRAAAKLARAAEGPV